MNKNKELALKDCYITGAAVIDRETFMFVAQGDETLEDSKGKSIWGDKAPPARIIAHNTLRDSWSMLEYDDGYFSGGLGTIAGGYIKGHKRALVVNHMGRVAYLEFAEGVNDSEARINHKTNIIFGCENTRLIGNHFYVAGGDRRIAKRIAPNEWVYFTPEPNHDKEAPDFDAIDGFNETDIYTGGDDYNLWHFDGTNWELMDAPYEWRMTAICCADDGLVYVGGLGGEILVGHKDTGWKEVVGKSDTGIGDINFIQRFHDRLYVMTDNYLWELVDGELIGARFDDDNAPTSFGHLSVNDGVMLVAGAYGAAVYNGQSWTNLIGGVSQTDALKVQLMERQVDNLEKVRDAAYDIDEAIKSGGNE